MSASSTDVFKKILLKGPDSFYDFGPVGRKLVSFLNVLGDHPEIDSLFFDESDDSLCDLADLARHAESLGMHFFKKHLPILAGAQASKKLTHAPCPSGNGARARFLKSHLKTKARETRSVQIFRSDAFKELLSEFWHSLPDDFSSFRRGHSPSIPSRMREVVKNFSNLDCLNLSSAAEGLIVRFYDPESVLGYKRISPSDAAMILVKKELGAPSLECMPEVRLVPLVEPPHEADDAEHCPFLSFHPVFDNYVAVTIKDCEAGAVLGERDGKCYFICESRKVKSKK
jgi:hypothetical protein